MDSYEETFRTWNKVAALYEEKFMHLNIYDESYDAFCAAITKTNAAILDVGCGPGNITLYLLQQRPELKVHGVDIAPNMIELAKVNNPTASFEVMDVRLIVELQQKFDGIVCGFCLPYLSPDEANKLLKDCNALLNKNGVLYMSFVEGSPNESGFKTSSTGNRAFFHYYELALVKTILLNNGFNILQLIKVDYPAKNGSNEQHTIIIANKTN